MTSFLRDTAFLARAVTAAVQLISGRVRTVENHLHGHDEHLRAIDERLVEIPPNLDAVLTSLNTRIGGHGRTLVRVEVERLDNALGRLTTVEGKVRDLGERHGDDLTRDDRLRALQDAYSAQQRRLDDLEARERPLAQIGSDEAAYVLGLGMACAAYTRDSAIATDAARAGAVEYLDRVQRLLEPPRIHLAADLADPEPDPEPQGKGGVTVHIHDAATPALREAASATARIRSAQNFREGR